ncbi:MAG: metallophosphoesterase [Bacteroides sp.]
MIKWIGVPVPHVWGISLGVTILVLTLGHIHFRNPVAKHQTIELAHSTEQKNSMRVVAVSDLHLGYGINRARLKQYVQRINEQKPNLILIGGDLIDMSVRPLWEENMQEELNKLNAPLGVYMVLGNHEYISGSEAACESIRSTNIRLLRDSVVKLPNGIQIVGRDDRSNPARLPITDLLVQTDPATPVFVLDHQPANWEVEQMVDTNRADFSFFGHTHKGQIWPLNFVTSLVYRQDYGYQLRNKTHLYVSSGLGLWGPPFRIGTDSEIVVIDFTF